jgi:REP element-mobilizing transposase RayT
MKPTQSPSAPSAIADPSRALFPFLCARSLAASRNPVLVTLETRRRRCLFEPGRAARDVFDLCVLNEHTVAACLLPDRLHWLLETGQGLAGEVRRFRELSERIARRRRLPGTRRGLWRTAYRAEAQPTTPQVVDTARSILSAPVASGLVERIEDWPYQLWRL